MKLSFALASAAMPLPASTFRTWSAALRSRLTDVLTASGGRVGGISGVVVGPETVWTSEAPLGSVFSSPL